MGNFLSKKEKIVKGIESYINYVDIYRLDNVIHVFNDKRVHKQLSIYTDSLGFDFDYNFHLNVKNDDKFKKKYLKHALAICLSFLDDEYKNLLYMKKKDTTGFIDKVIKPLGEKLTFTIKHYTFFRPLHYNCVKIQRWFRKNKQSKQIN